MRASCSDLVEGVISQEYDDLEMNLTLLKACESFELVGEGVDELSPSWLESDTKSSQKTDAAYYTRGVVLGGSS
jgi:hypothetical protein